MKRDQQSAATGAGARLREMLARAGYSLDRFAKAVGFRGASSIQRYTEEDRGFLPFDKVERFAPKLVGKGEPPITREEVYALSGVNPVPLSAVPRDTSNNNTRTGEIEIVRGADNIGYMEPDLPLLGRPHESGLDTYIFGDGNDAVVALTARPRILNNVPGAYAIYTYGDAMAPRYRPGEMLFVDPIRPTAPGDDVVIRLRDGTGFVRQLVRRTAQAVVCCQYNPPIEIEIPIATVRSIHLIIASTRIRV